MIKSDLRVKLDRIKSAVIPADFEDMTKEMCNRYVRKMSDEELEARIAHIENEMEVKA